MSDEAHARMLERVRLLRIINGAVARTMYDPEAVVDHEYLDGVARRLRELRRQDGLCEDCGATPEADLCWRDLGDLAGALFGRPPG